MYHELYIAGIVTVLRRSSYGYLNKDGSIYFEVRFPLMYRLQVPVLEQLQCRVKKPKTDSEQPITMKPNRNLWEWTTIKFNFICELYTVLGKRKKKSAIRHSVRLKKGGGGFFLWQKLYHYTNTNCSFYTSTRVFLFGFQTPNSTPLFTLFVCGGNSPCGTYIFIKPPTVFKHTQVNTATSISKKGNRTISKPYLHTGVCISK